MKFLDSNKNLVTNRSNAIDVLKAVAALMVCYQHACGTGIASEYLLSLARIAVPLFVMITGYFYMETVKLSKQKIQIKKFFKIAVGMFILYFCVDVLSNLTSHNLSNYLMSFINPQNIFNFFVFNDPIAADHSWYMWAMIYVLLIVWLMPFVWKNKVVRFIAIISVLLSVPLISKYYFLFSDTQPAMAVYRNFLIPVSAYFLIGITIRQYQDKIICISKRIRCALCILSILLIFSEKYLLSRLDLDQLSGTYFFTSVFAIMLFCLFLDMNVNNKYKRIAKFGRKYSLLFYVIHPIFVRVEVKLFNMQGYQQYIGFLMVALCTYITVFLFYVIKEKIYIRKTHNAIKSKRG